LPSNLLFVIKEKNSIYLRIFSLKNLSKIKSRQKWWYPDYIAGILDALQWKYVVMAVLVPYLDASWRASTWQGQGAGTRQSIVPAPVSSPTYCGCGPRSCSSSASYTPNAHSLLKPFIDCGVPGSIYGSSCGISAGQICAGTGFCLSTSVLPRHLSFYQWPYSYVRFEVYILTADVKQTTRKTAKPQDLKWDEIFSYLFFLHVGIFLGTRQTGNLK